MCGALAFLLDDVCVRFGSGLCGRIVGVPVGAGCAPLVAGLFLFCCGGGGGLRVVLFGSGVVGASSSAFRCLDGLLGVGSGFFDSMVDHMHPSELQLNGANVSDADPCFEIHIYIYIGWFCEDWSL